MADGTSLIAGVREMYCHDEISPEAVLEEALRSALAPDAQAPKEKNVAPTLLQRMQSPAQEKRKIILGPSDE